MNVKEAENLRDIIAVIEKMKYEVQVVTIDDGLYPKTVSLKVRIPNINGDAKP